MSHRPQPTDATCARLARVAAQVRGAFVRVLERDPAVRIHPDEDGDLEVKLRDKTYKFSVRVTSAAACVYVTNADPDENGDVMTRMFFNFNCPIGRMGRLRQTALILYKKMQHAEVYEVMQA